MEDRRYPAGPFVKPEQVSAADRKAWLGEIAALPGRLADAVAGLTPPQLDTRYRPEGWTIRQVVHHLADSHMNAFVRFRLALTEDNPTIKPYEEAAWAELVDGRSGDVAASLAILGGLHSRWVVMAEAMTEDQWARTFFHPERRSTMRLDVTLAMYAWHCRHHLAHVTGTVTREGWR